MLNLLDLMKLSDEGVGKVESILQNHDLDIEKMC
jgi:hypothetical protein